MDRSHSQETGRILTRLPSQEPSTAQQVAPSQELPRWFPPSQEIPLEMG